MNRFFLIALLIFSGCATQQPGWVHPNFSHYAPELNQIYVSQPDIVVDLQTFDGNDKMLIDMSRTISQILRKTIGNEVVKHGFATTDSTIPNEKFQKNDNLYLVMGEIRDRHYAMVVDAMGRAKSISDLSYRYSFGPNARRLSNSTDSDAFILAVGRGSVRTEGEKNRYIVRGAAVTIGTMGWGYQMLHHADGSIHVSLVDGKTGAVLWHNSSAFDKHHDLTDLAKVQKMMQDMFQSFPTRLAVSD